MSRQLWQTILVLPQTYLLIVGVGLGYALWVVVLGQRPLVLGVGGAISLLSLAFWVVQVAVSPALAVRQRLERSQDLLDETIFNRQVDQIRSHYHSAIATGARSDLHLWQQTLEACQDCRSFAAEIVKRRSALTVEALETLHTVLELLKQIGRGIQVTRQVETDTYRQLAQQRLATSRDRLNATRAQLQLLQDQLALSSLDESPTASELPVNLTVLIQANAAAIAASTDARSSLTSSRSQQSHQQARPEKS
ncbi:MAG: hypothetical protein AAFY15_02635 [Cyanobacteria bacterium J06648_11]